MNICTAGFQTISCQFETLSKWLNIRSEFNMSNLFYDASERLQISLHREMTP